MPRAERLQAGMRRAVLSAQSAQTRVMESARRGDIRHASVDAQLVALEQRVALLEAALQAHREMPAHLPNLGGLSADR